SARLETTKTTRKGSASSSSSAKGGCALPSGVDPPPKRYSKCISIRRTVTGRSNSSLAISRAKLSGRQRRSALSETARDGSPRGEESVAHVSVTDVVGQSPLSRRPIEPFSMALKEVAAAAKPVRDVGACDR